MFALHRPGRISFERNRTCRSAGAAALIWISVGCARVQGGRADSDTPKLFDIAGEAVARARRGEGPTLIEIEIYRFYGHFQGDPEVYRPKGEVAALKAKDPIPRLRQAMLAEGVTAAEADAAVARAHAAVDEAFAFARAAAYPEQSHHDRLAGHRGGNLPGDAGRPPRLRDG
jgi:TPP-dependent pyruvate/acetoin dehydrogenase alpha subunit